MQSHVEIIMPPADDYEQAIDQALQPFCHRTDDAYCPFWDWLQIGGCYAGAKLHYQLGEERLQAFNQALVDRRTTVSRVIAGRQSLSPASQIPEVDAPWREHFIHHVLNPATAGSFNPPFLQRNPSGGGSQHHLGTLRWHREEASAPSILVAALPRKAVTLPRQTRGNGQSGISRSCCSFRFLAAFALREQKNKTRQQDCGMQGDAGAF